MGKIQFYEMGKAEVAVEVCLAKHCVFYNSCAMSVKPSDAMIVRWISPADTGEFCDLYKEQEYDC